MICVLIEEQQETQSRVCYTVCVHTLRAMNFNGRGTFLFLIYPVLKANLVDPFCSSLTLTRTGPLATGILCVCSETHPAGAAGMEVEVDTDFLIKP